MINSSFRNVAISELSLVKSKSIKPLNYGVVEYKHKAFLPNSRLCSCYQPRILTAFSIPARTPYDSKVNTRTRGITELGKRTQGDLASMPFVRDIIINSQVILAYAIKINNGFLRNWYRDVWVMLTIGHGR